MSNPIARYFHWLHGQWPAGTVESLPEVGQDGATNVPGVRIVGDLSGVPLLKFSSDTGARAIHAILKESDFQGARGNAEIDVAIIGGGVSGISAAIEAKKADLSYVLYEAGEVFSTIVNFPIGKPIYTYPTDMTPAGGIQYGESSDTREALLDDVRAQAATHEIEATPERVERVEKKGGVIEIHRAGGGVTKATRCVIAIGRSGNYRKLGVEGEELDKVSNRLHDPKEFSDKDVLIVGGGDSAVEGAVALAEKGARVTLSYRKDSLTRPKPENVEKISAMGDSGRLRLALGSNLEAIREAEVQMQGGEVLPNDAVFAMIGREAPLDFFRRSGIKIAGERTSKWWITAVLTFLAAMFLYQWKKEGTWLPIGEWWKEKGLFPYALSGWWSGLGEVFSNPHHLFGVAKKAIGEPGFYYSALYCLVMLGFGIRRIARRRTPYVRRQTFCLWAVQIFFLFLLPYFLLPWMGNNGWFGDRVVVEAWNGESEESVPAKFATQLNGLGDPEADLDYWSGAQWKWPEAGVKLTAHEGTGLLYLQDDRERTFLSHLSLFPPAEYGFGREYWRGFGLVLAWPLFVYNWFTEAPLWGWLLLGVIQTFVIIPLIVRRWGKGAYCGWICSCGGLAETMGDAHRHKMPHGPFWNKVNRIGQVFLGLAALLMVLRILGWMFGGVFSKLFHIGLYGNTGWTAQPWGYIWFVDLLFAGILGVAFYFHLSGRVWCRFACPLAALMHIYARFSKFRIFADKKKCISCNVCTSVCHQGIDIMNFANKGAPMEDPQCVRCSACVQQCPTGVLSFGRYGSGAEEGVVFLDRLKATNVEQK